MITLDNYEAFLLDKAEGTLSKQAERELDEFLSEHSELNGGIIDTDSKIKFTYSTNEEFKLKKTLMRPVFNAFTWVKAAAVVLFVVASAYFVYTFSDNTPPDSPVAKVSSTPQHDSSTIKSVDTVTYAVKPQKHVTQNIKPIIKNEKTQDLINEEPIAVYKEKQPSTEPKTTETQNTAKQTDLLIVYKQSDRTESQNLVAYAEPEPTGLKKMRNEAKEFFNKIRG
ncbi:MAG: hypothetical protein IJ250_06450 [Bacteroidales bacterium]|nr:hypothetical protein [Bacteroidales bacterium]